VEHPHYAIGIVNVSCTQRQSLIERAASLPRFDAAYLWRMAPSRCRVPAEDSIRAGWAGGMG